MDFTLLQRAVSFHGQQLLDAVREEQGENVAQHLVLSCPVPSSQSIENDERKAVLAKFIAQKADMLFQKYTADIYTPAVDYEDGDTFAIMPPLECFMQLDADTRKKCFYQNLAKYDIVIGCVTGKHLHGLLVTLKCMGAEKVYQIDDLNLQCFCSAHQITPLSVHEDPLDALNLNDVIQGVVMEVLPESEKIYISLKDSALPAGREKLFSGKLGLISEDDLPLNYKKYQKWKGEKYETILKRTLGFMNPSSVFHLCNMMGLVDKSPSLMRGLYQKVYPLADYASSIYKAQCTKWAYKSVQEGVAHFKAGRTSEAYECFSKALQMDPKNVEAFVARGALFANKNSFSRALEDFEQALKFDPRHANAVKFTVETLVAYGKQHEDNGSATEAIKCYKKALALNPGHSEAIYFMQKSHKKQKEGRERSNRDLEEGSESSKKINDCVTTPEHKESTKDKLRRLLSSEKRIEFQ